MGGLQLVGDDAYMRPRDDVGIVPYVPAASKAEAEKTAFVQGKDWNTFAILVAKAVEGA